MEAEMGLMQPQAKEASHRWKPDEAGMILPWSLQSKCSLDSGPQSCERTNVCGFNIQPVAAAAPGHSYTSKERGENSVLKGIDRTSGDV